MPELHPPRVGDADHRGGVEPHADRIPGRQLLMRGGGGDQGRGVADRDPRGEPALPDEVPLELLRVHTRFVGGRIRRVARRRRLGRRGAEHPGELAVEVDQLLGHGLALVGVGVQ